MAGAASRAFTRALTRPLGSPRSRFRSHGRPARGGVGGHPGRRPYVASPAARAGRRRRRPPCPRAPRSLPPGPAAAARGRCRRRRERPAGGDEPSVEVIVPFRDRPDLLERCARSLLERSAYERLVVRLVDNGSEDPITAELLASLQHHARVTVDADRPPVQLLGPRQRRGPPLRRRCARLPRTTTPRPSTRTGSRRCCARPAGPRSAPSRRCSPFPTGASSTPASRSACTVGRATRSPAWRRRTRRRSAERSTARATGWP